MARRYEFYVRVAICKNNISRVSQANSEILFLPRECLFLLYGETNSTKAKGGNRDVIERYNAHKGDIRKIRHSGPE